MPDADLLRLCWDYVVNGVRSDELANEVYSIIDANLKHFRIELYHGRAVCDEVRQDCALKVFGYTIGHMMTQVSASGKINAHSYIFQAAYNEVGQFIRKFTRRKAIRFYEDDLNELLGTLVFDGDTPTVVKESSNG